MSGGRGFGVSAGLAVATAARAESEAARRGRLAKWPARGPKGRRVGMLMPVSSAQSEAMKRIVTLVHVVLKEHTFRKRGNGFNHEVEPGCVHVVRFQMGAFNPPGTVEIPGLRPNLYGRFTVNLGVYLDAVREQTRFPATRPGFINDYNCHLRQRLGFLMDPPADRWWPLDSPDEVGPLVRDLIVNVGLAWLHGLSCQDQILSVLETAPPGSRRISGGPDRLLATQLRLARGEKARAQDNFTDWVHSGSLTSSHQNYLAQMAAEYGLSMDAAS